MRAVPLVFPLLLALSLPAWAQVQSKDQQKCIKTLNKAYDGVAKAQRSTINRCINLGSKGKLPTTINACVLADDKGRVLRAQQKTLAKEAVACGAAPDFGATSGANVNAEAVAGELSALSGLLGSDLDAPFDPADKASARCQRKVVKAAGKCSALLVKDYAQCAVRSLAGKDGEPAADEFGLVRCKGSDRKGIVAKVCDVKLAAAIAKGCAGQDLDTLFPGCEGQDLATCARGHAQAGPNGGLNASAGICEPDPSLPVPPPTEPTSIADVPLPSGVTIPSERSSVQFTKDGSRILFSLRTTAVGGTHLGTIAEDGSDFDCLTCALGSGVTLTQAHPATDGSRIAVRSGNALQRHSIVECSPSVVDCQSVEIVPVEIPTFGAAVLRHAQMRISPDNQRVLFTQLRLDGGIAAVLGELDRQVDRYDVVNPRALTAFRPVFSGPSGDLVLEAVGDWGEAKEFADGGASILYYTTIDALNFDPVKLDLATGAITRLTRQPEYDEDLQESPDGQWYAIGSYRNHDRMKVFSQVPRPPIVDLFTRNPVALLRNTSSGRRFFDLWLQDEYGSREGYIGQQLNLPNDPDWATRGAHGWHPDSTRIVYLEQLNPDLGTQTVLRVVTFTSRSPTPPLPIVPSPEPTWAPLLADLGGIDESTVGSLLGSASGRVEVDFQLTTAPADANGNVRVDYVDYSSDGRAILNGTEIASAAGLDVTWTANVRLSGCRQGFLSADTSFVVLPPSGSGTIASEVDGKSVEGLPER